MNKDHNYPRRRRKHSSTHHWTPCWNNHLHFSMSGSNAANDMRSNNLRQQRNKQNCKPKTSVYSSVPQRMIFTPFNRPGYIAPVWVFYVHISLRVITLKTQVFSNTKTSKTLSSNTAEPILPKQKAHRSHRHRLLIS